MLEHILHLRHTLHEHPERSGSEQETMRRIAAFLMELPGWKVLTDLGGFGVWAYLDGGRPGSHTALRAELDALPITENTGLPYASRHPGTGHHCGHDGHMATLCGVAQQLTSDPSFNARSFRGRISLLFQPAEETGEGAATMIKALREVDFQADRILAMHNIPGQPLGTVLVRSGTMLVASSGAEITFMGVPSHAAEPEKGVHPWPAVRALTDEVLGWGSTLVPLDQQAKITLVGSQLGGPHFGTSPAEAQVWFTLRAYDTALLDDMKVRLLNRASDLGHIYGLQSNVHFTEEFEATVNDPSLVEDVRATAAEQGVPVSLLHHPYSYSEDFGRFAALAPTLFFGMGAGEHHPALHSDQYDYPDALLPRSIILFLRLLKRYHG